MSDKPKLMHLENIIGKEMSQKLDEIDQQVREYHLSLDNHNLRDFDEFMNLLSQLIIAIRDEISGFVPKFTRGSPISEVLTLSAVGSFRSLRVAHKLLLKGYFPEMHATLRMVQQWSECAVIVEACPDLAPRISEKGVRKKDRIKAS